ncbi:hypothetical protein C9E91_01495 [Rhizobium sp. SEMIA4064]|nr:hypothetical protein C9E91_01495 [Rhizobium sp. SEMIA4064]
MGVLLGPTLVVRGSGFQPAHLAMSAEQMRRSDEEACERSAKKISPRSGSEASLKERGLVM